MLRTRVDIHTTLQRRLCKAQDAMKLMTDKHRRDITFAIGDWVYVRLRPYRQTSLAPAYTKLAKRFYGLFQVIERISLVAFKL